MPPRKSPDAFRTISEVAQWLGVSAHVLRFWETKFPQIKPVKRAGGRRYYRPSDMELLGGIRHLLYDDGLTIKGVQKVLREKGVKHVSSLSSPVAPSEDDAGATTETEEAAQDVDATQPATATGTDVGATPASEEAKDEQARAPEQASAAETEADVEHERGPEAEADLPPRAPLPGAPEGQLGLFADLPPLGELVSHEASAPAAGSDGGGGATGASDAPAAIQQGGPAIAPLPGADLPLPEALSRLSSAQVDRDALAPILARAEALRERMAAGTGG